MGDEKYNGGLVARIDTVSDLSLSEVASNLKNFVAHENNVDVFVAELYPQVTDKINSYVLKGDNSFKFYDVGFLSLLMGRVCKKNIDAHYTTFNDLPGVISKVKQSMIDNEKNTLYQLCLKENKDKVKEILESNDFKLI